MSFMHFGFKQACLALTLLSITSLFPEDLFTTCRFHFGTPDGIAAGNTGIMAQVDYLTSWAGSSENFNQGGFYQTCKNNGKTPVIVSYILAFTARRDWSLQDCNVDQTNNLCKRGADYIRQQKPRIMGQYAKFAKGAADSYGTDKYMVWCMEPDYSQYADAGQNNGGLTAAECGALMNQILDTIKKYLPKALFSMDISPWKDTTWQKTWFAGMNMSRFTFVNTSGGQARADQTFISDTWSTALPTWAWVRAKFGTPLIADAGYGAGGSSTGHDTRWDNVANLTARIKDGVLCVAQANPSSNWGSTISSLRSQLPTPPLCPTGPSKTVEPWKHSGACVRQGAMVSGPGRVVLFDISGRAVFSRDLSGAAITIRSLRKFSDHVPKAMYILQWTGPAGEHRELLAGRGKW
jgi:hypothetical protein